MGSYEVEPKLTEDGFLSRHYSAIINPKNQDKTKYMTIILHGQTSNLDKWNDRCQQIRKAINNNVVIAIQAPIEGTKLDEKTNTVVPAYSWLDIDNPLVKLTDFALHLTTGIPVVNRLEKFIDTQAERYGVEKKNIAIMGHSMGGILALQLAFNSTVPHGAIFGTGTALLPFTRKKSEPHLFLAMGSEDDIFNKKEAPNNKKGLSKLFNKAVKALFSMQQNSTVARLGRKKIAYSYRTYPNQTHEIAHEMWADGVTHVVAHLVSKHHAVKCNKRLMKNSRALIG